MRSYEEYHQILTLWEKYGNKKRIARETGIPRGTIHDCIRKFGSVAGLEQYSAEKSEIMNISSVAIELQSQSTLYIDKYAYLLGLYLGDGCINRVRNVQLLRIALDKKYPQIIQQCIDAMENVLPDNSVHIVEATGCVYVSCYYKFWDQIFPQHGDGKKHDREIILEDWQQHIVDQHPLEFFRGLYHSDGSRSQNIVKGRNYPRYTFSNYSDDIRKLFTDTAEKLGLNWTTANARNVAISKRDDVIWLDEHIGKKA